jgi:MFS family permease
MGYGMYAYIFPNFLTFVNATPPEVGLVSTILAASMALTLLPGGVLSDKGHRRKLVIASWFLPVFAPLFFILAQTADTWLYALPGVAMFGSSWIGVAAVQSYISEAAPTGKRGLSFGILVSSGSIGLIPSPLIGGLVVETYGFTALFLLALILYAISTAMVLTIPRLPGDSIALWDSPSRGLVKPSEEGRNEARILVKKDDESMGKVSRLSSRPSVLRRLIPMLALSCLFMGFVYLGWSYIPLYLSEHYGFNYYSVQLMYAIANLSSIVIINALGKLSDRFSPSDKLALIIVPITAIIFGYWILLDAPSLLVLSGSFILMGSVAAIFPLVYSTVGEMSAGRSVGRTYGVIGTFIYAAEATTPYLGGVLYANSIGLPFTVVLILSPVLFVAVYLAHRKTD